MATHSALVPDTHNRDYPYGDTTTLPAREQDAPATMNENRRPCLRQAFVLNRPK